MRAPRRSGPKKHWRMPDKEWLECEYLTKKKSSRRIAREIDGSVATVREWLQKHKISIRNLREAGKLRRAPGSSGSYRRFRGEARKVINSTGLSSCCCICREKSDIIIHHRDGDITNNKLENLLQVCRMCHAKLHDGRIIDGNPSGYIE